MTRTKAFSGAIAEMHCSVMAEIFTNGSKMHPGSILVNSVVRHNCGTIRENTLMVPQSDRSH